jgi:mRNA interferase RelE/StbE
MKTIVLTHAAARDLDRLPIEARTAISTALTAYAVSGRGDVKKLSGRDGHRMRIGAYRVLFAEDATTILAVYIGRRATMTCKRK